MAKFVEIDFEDEDDILHHIDIIEVKSRLMLKRILDEITSFGYHVLQSHVPRHTSYLLRHVDREQPRWRPGGAGGGGEYESVVGVKRGTSKHPFYVEFGTGLYGAVGWFIVPNFAQYMDVGGQIGDWIRKGLEKVPGGKLILGAAGKVAGLLHLAGGGPVPGGGSGDIVSALLEPGEHVLTKREVAAAGGHDVIFALRALLGGGGQGSGGRYQPGGQVAGAGSLTIDFHGGSLDDFTSQWRRFWIVLLRTAHSGTGDIEAEFRQMRVNTTRSVDRMYRDVRGSISDIQRSFMVRSRDLIDNWRGAWLQLSNLAFKGLSYIGHEANRALTGFGANAIHFGLSAPAAMVFPAGYRPRAGHLFPCAYWDAGGPTYGIVVMRLYADGTLQPVLGPAPQGLPPAVSLDFSTIQFRAEG